MMFQSGATGLMGGGSFLTQLQIVVKICIMSSSIPGHNTLSIANSYILSGLRCPISQLYKSSYNSLYSFDGSTNCNFSSFSLKESCQWFSVSLNDVVTF